MKACGYVLAALVASSGVARADDCDSFNLVQFTPRELERCIEHMKMEQQIQEMEINNLNIELCTVALKLDHLEPGDNLVPAFCPKKSGGPKKPKGPAPSGKPVQYRSDYAYQT